jgi:glycosyltransferase involved in cell wall biosynthesis
MSSPVSLIIAIYNKTDVFRLVLTALERQTWKDFEVLLADDGSNPEAVKEVDTLLAACPFPSKHLWQEDQGWQKNKILNKTVAAAAGEYLIFLDGDCIPHPKFVQEHMENRLENHTISGRRVLLTKKVSVGLTKEKIQQGYLDRRVFFPLLMESLFHGEKTDLMHMIRIRNKFLRRILVPDKPRGIIGCNFSAWKKDVMRVNGFDEQYVYPGFGEDCDLDDRLQRNGVYPVSRKHLITTYHFFHVHFDTLSGTNKQLWEEKKRTHEKYTPNGIVKNNGSRSLSDDVFQS